MMGEAPPRGFDCLRFVREVRARNDRETRDMSWEVFRQWLDSRRPTDRGLAAAGDRAKPPRGEERRPHEATDDDRASRHHRRWPNPESARGPVRYPLAETWLGIQVADDLRQARGRAGEDRGRAPGGGLVQSGAGVQ